MPGGPRRLQLAPRACLPTTLAARAGSVSGVSSALGSRLVDQLEAEVAARLAA